MLTKLFKEISYFFNEEFKNWHRNVLVTFFITLAYFLISKFCFLMSISPGYISSVWFPSGVATGLILYYGFKQTYLGIFLGSFLINSWFFQKNLYNYGIIREIIVALFIASGSLLQAWVCATNIDKFIGKSFHNISNLLKFYLIAPICCVISSTIGVSASCINNFVLWENFGYSWLSWFLGDCLGILIVTPFFLTWDIKRFKRWTLDSYLEILFIFISLMFILNIVFSLGSKFGFGHLFFLLPLFTWCAIRFCQFVVVSSFFLTILISIYYTSTGWNLLGNNNIHLSLILIQFYIVISGFSQMIISIYLDQLRESERVLREAYKDIELKIKVRTEELENLNLKLTKELEEHVEDKKRLQFSYIENQRLKELTLLLDKKV